MDDSFGAGDSIGVGSRCFWMELCDLQKLKYVFLHDFDLNASSFEPCHATGLSKEGIDVFRDGDFGKNEGTILEPVQDGSRVACIV